MKALFIFMLLAVPSLAIAQGFTGKTTFNDEQKVEYNVDPLTSYILKSDAPCNDKSNWGLREGTVKEGAVTEACQDYHKLIDERLSNTTSVDTGNEEPVNLRPYYIMAGTTTVISIIFIVAI